MYMLSMIATACLLNGIEEVTDFSHSSDIQLFFIDSFGLQGLEWLVCFNSTGYGFYHTFFFFSSFSPFTHNKSYDKAVKNISLQKQGLSN